MKYAKKLFSILLVLTLVLSLGANAFAATVTINEKDPTSTTHGTYEAYKLLDLETALKCGQEAGAEHTHTDACYTFNYTVNSTYRAVLQEVVAKAANAEADAAAIAAVTDEQILTYIAAQTGAKTRTFADDVYRVIKAKNMTTNITSTDGVFSGLDQGYYMIIETGTNPEGGAYSAVILDTMGQENVTITAKEDIPSVDKQVEEVNDSKAASDSNPKWGNTADHDIGDSINYKLTAKMPTTFEGYDAYYVKFNDKMTNLVYNADGKLSIKVGNTTYPTTGTKTLAELQAAGVLTTTWTHETHSDSKADCGTLTVEIKDLLKLAKELGYTGDLAGLTEAVITIDYSATLEDCANIGGNGNPNTVDLDYSRNPNDDYDGTGTPDTGKTGPKTCVVFTLEADADKYNETNTKLPGAGFTLLKKVATTPTASDDVVIFESQDALTEFLNSTDGDKGYAGLDASKTYYVKGGTADAPVYYEVVKAIAPSSNGTSFEFAGLDAGEYVLVETTVPTGYKKGADIEFEIEATYGLVEDSEDTYEVKSLEVKGVDGENFTVKNEQISTGTVLTDVHNSTSPELPETGGIGTTIFYVAGGLMVAAAAIILVTKKRMGAAE